MDSVVKHELASSAYNKRRQSCEAAVAAIQKKHPHVEFLRDCTMEMLEEAKAEISAEDYMRAEYVIEEIQRVLDVCEALEKDDYETVGKKMYETHQGMSKLYEVSCEELDFLNENAASIKAALKWFHFLPLPWQAYSPAKTFGPLRS